VLPPTVIPSPEARKNLMKLAQRMTRSFCINISTSSGLIWTALSDSPDDTVRITTRKITDPGQPYGLILSAVSTTWLPCPHYHVFDLLKDERRRSQVQFRLANSFNLFYQKINFIYTLTVRVISIYAA
jgi:hypothetical protein